MSERETIDAAVIVFNRHLEFIATGVYSGAFPFAKGPDGKRDGEMIGWQQWFREKIEEEIADMRNKLNRESV